jgi:hypothetical protein
MRSHPSPDVEHVCPIPVALPADINKLDFAYDACYVSQEYATMKVAKISHIARAKAANDTVEMKASNAASFDVELDRPSEYLSSNPKQIKKKHDVA